jgi:radical SAM protein with 4Fe4S-binding SPASM domain
MATRLLRKPFALIRAIGSARELPFRILLPPRPVSSTTPRFGETHHIYHPIAVLHLPVQAAAGDSLLLMPMAPSEQDALVDLTIQLDATRSELGRYLYSKLYYSTHPDQPFSEDAVVCFEVPQRFRAERIQVSLPETAMAQARISGHLRLRVDGLPYSQGRWQLLQLRLASASLDPERTRCAQRTAHRQWVREQVRASERQRRAQLPHYPESVSIELTPVCNLRCPHCSSHGMPHLHKHHNGQPEMSVARLRRLAHEVFPHVSVVSVVGRGEPTLASDALWNCLTEQLREHDVRLSCVTNGTRVRQRFDAALMPWVHELIFSMDGGTAETFEINRAGAKFERVMENLSYYHELRNSVPQSRRPQLTISWTLKHNNVAELPDFVRRIAPFEPDLLSLRHLVVFQDKERGESLLEHAREANAALAEAYAELDRLGLRHESPPLSLDATSTGQAHESVLGTSTKPSPQEAGRIPGREALIVMREPECNWMHRTAIVMADGEVITCGKHYGEQVGHLTDENSLWDIWNGPKMHSLRDGFGRAHMWEQCKDCWLRELKWHSQRQAKDLSTPYSLADGMDYTEAAWDYRRYSEL